MLDLNDTARAALLDRYLPSAGDNVRSAAENMQARKSITVHAYKDIPVTERFWRSGDHQNRTWLFALHSFAPLDALMAVGAWDGVKTLVEEWRADFVTDQPIELGSFPWHDHATALRLDRLSLMRLSGQGPDLPKLAEDHATLLLREDFYSKHTNHGFDQALALLLASYAFAESCDTSAWLEIGLARLIDEIEFAFNDEGVHVENSPAYHVGMTANLMRARFVKETLGIKTTFDFDTLLNKALLFTAWITGPSRTLAMLGDSTERGGQPSEELANLPNYQHVSYASSGGTHGKAVDSNVAVYPGAGYAIYRSAWFPWRNHVHLVMKSGFLSQYHRQDDDLNILLQAHGEHWLIDSGLYNHNQKDPTRIYMRSALAHNIPYIKDRSVSRRLPAPGKGPTLEGGEHEGYAAVFKGTTRMYSGTTLHRTVMVEDPDNIQLIDRFDHRDDTPETFVLFHVPADKRIATSPHMARIIGKNKELQIRLSSGKSETCRLYSGMDADFKSVYSPSINVSQESQVIVFGPIHSNRVRFRLHFAGR